MGVEDALKSKGRNGRKSALSPGQTERLATILKAGAVAAGDPALLGELEDVAWRHRQASGD